VPAIDPIPSLSRRALLRRCANGFGSVALTAMLADDSRGAPASGSASNFELAATTHHRPKAKRVIFLYMDGGPSQIDLFDHKPLLKKYHGRDPREVIGKLEPTQFDSVGKVLQSPWNFRQHGDSGQWISSLLPHLSRHADKLAVVKSMTSKFSEHSSANFFLHCGTNMQGRPSMGSWFSYGLGNENQSLPSFVVINGGLIPKGGLDCFGCGYLPATYQGSLFLPRTHPVANLNPLEPEPQQQRRKLELISSIDRGFLSRSGGADPAIEGAIANYETAFHLQSSLPDLADLSGETDLTRHLYGMKAPLESTRTFGRQCLLARRLIERGVRFVELTCPDNRCNGWDQHEKLRQGHEVNCQTVDQPIAGLLSDLERRGLLDETLVVWAGEFGRTPFAQGSDGRFHHLDGGWRHPRRHQRRRNR
jgi:hypothetical protein